MGGSAPAPDIIQQRLHEVDLVGHALAKEDGQCAIVLPKEYEGSLYSSPLGSAGDDRCKETGDLLWPERYRAKLDASLKIDLGEYGTADQLQQRPKPAASDTFRSSRSTKSQTCEHGQAIFTGSRVHTTESL